MTDIIVLKPGVDFCYCRFTAETEGRTALNSIYGPNLLGSAQAARAIIHLQHHFILLRHRFMRE